VGLWATLVTGDDDIRAILPELPPPAPKPRETAIRAALARFDGMPVPMQKPQSEWALWWAKLNRPQVGLISAAVVVAAISLPFALQKPVPGSPVTAEQASPRAQGATSSNGQRASSRPTPIPTLEPPPEELNAVAGNQPISQPKNSSLAESPIGIAQAAPAVPPSPAMRVDESAAIVVQGRAVTQNLQDIPLAASAVSSETFSRDESAIVVTSARKAAARPVPRGDWNACTVNDPGRTLARCQKLARNAANSVRSQAESYLSDGLKNAWDGQLEKAIEAFDAAIEVSPDLSEAYLNRGLVYDQQGNGEAAIADLNLAVRFSPRSARVYYNRSVLLKKYGKLKRAQADEQRAIKLDARYEAIRR